MNVPLFYDSVVLWVAEVNLGGWEKWRWEAVVECAKKLGRFPIGDDIELGRPRKLMERSESVLVAFDVLYLDSLRWELSDDARCEEDDIVVRC